jgi:hypothetical protein
MVKSTPVEELNEFFCRTFLLTRVSNLSQSVLTLGKEQKNLVPETPLAITLLSPIYCYLVNYSFEHWHQWLFILKQCITATYIGHEIESCGINEKVIGKR